MYEIFRNVVLHVVRCDAGAALRIADGYFVALPPKCLCINILIIIVKFASCALC